MLKINKYKKVLLLSLLIFGLCVIAFLIRFVRLDNLPVFADEAIYIRWAQVMRAEATLRFLPMSDGKQPLFMWVVIPFLKFVSDPLVAGRLVSVLTGIGTLVGVATAAYFLFGNFWVVVIASLFYALSPFGVFFDRMALVDSMLSMFGVWVFVFAYLTVKKERLDFAMITGILLGLALVTKSSAIYFAIFLPFLIILSDNLSKKLLKVTLAKNVFFLAVIYLFGFVIYNILRLGPNFNMLSLRSMDYVYPVLHIIQKPLDPLLAHLGGIFDYFVKLGPLSLLILALAGGIALLKGKRRELLILLMWSLGPILISSEYAKVMTARYILMSLPFVILLASAFWLRRNFRTVGIIVVLVFVFQSLYINYLLLFDTARASLPRTERSGYLEEWTAGTGIAQIAEYINSERLRDQSSYIVVGTEGFFGTLPDGLQIYLNGLKDVIVIGVGLGFDKLPSSLVDSNLSGNRTYLVMNASRLLLTEAEKGKLELIGSYPKALRAIDSREYAMYGPYDSLLFYKLK